MTGKDFSRYWQQLIDKAYSGYYDAVKQNRLFKEVLIDIIQKKQSNGKTQQYYDELNRLTLVSEQKTLDANGFLPLTDIPNYMHLKTFSMETSIPLGQVESCEGNTVTFTTGIGMKHGQEITFVGVQPLSSTLNGTYYVSPVSRTRVKVYTDSACTIPLDIDPQFSTKGNAYDVSYVYGTVLDSDEKISVFSVADARNPKVQFGNGGLIFTPTTPNGTVKLDYWKLPPVFVDADNDVIDLEDTYTLKFLMYLAQESALRFKEIITDGEGTQLSNLAVVDNP